MNQRMLLFLLCFLIFCIRSSNEAISCIFCVPICAAGGVIRGPLLTYCLACISKCPMFWLEYWSGVSNTIILNKFNENIYFFK